MKQGFTLTNENEGGHFLTRFFLLLAILRGFHSTCVASLVRRARAGGHPGREPCRLREYWIPACAGMTTLLFLRQKPTLERG
ncbi:MAG: hypothetical protein EXR78_08845 [Deltaproteobacteria bacterium]|nr:hypothetical protein [Deltaproteobacteria bacterium]